MPYILVGLIAAIFFLDPYMSLNVKQFLYATSLSIKEGIVMVLPIIIFGLLFNSAISLSHGAARIIFLILGFVFISNFTATLCGQAIGRFVYDMDLSLVNPHKADGLAPLWNFVLPKPFRNDYAMFAGLILGIGLSHFNRPFGEKVGAFLNIVVAKLLKVLALAIPVFISGFIVKLNYDGLMSTIIKDYSVIFVIFAVAQFSYLGIAFWILNNGHVKTTLENLKNFIPALITGFSTMSSAAAMPLTLLAAKANAKQKDLSQSVISATCNNHMIGDCFAIIIFTFAIMKNFGLPEPSMDTFMVFAFYFVFVKFSVAGIPGGGVIVVLPFLEKYLGFSSDMLTLCTALYVLFDPVVTVGNILGNGAFSKLMDRIITYKTPETATQTV